IPLPGNLNVFLILEAAQRMGIEFEACDDMAPWVRVHKQILEYERAENERKILEEAEALAKELAEGILKEKEEEKAKAEAEAEEDNEGAEEQPEPVKVSTNPEDPPFYNFVKMRNLRTAESGNYMTMDNKGMNEQSLVSRYVVLMGVSGSGKSSVGENLSPLVGLPYQDGDDMHPQANIDKMESGTPLNDEDRMPW